MKHLLACYGTLKRGFHNNYLVQDGKYLGTFETKPEYKMVSYGGYPAVKRNGDTKITFELWEVDDGILENVYHLEGYTGVKGSDSNWYDVDVIETPHGDAQIFVMDSKASDGYGQIIDGIWKKS